MVLHNDWNYFDSCLSAFLRGNETFEVSRSSTRPSGCRECLPQPRTHAFLFHPSPSPLHLQKNSSPVASLNENFAIFPSLMTSSHYFTFILILSSHTLTHAPFPCYSPPEEETLIFASAASSRVLFRPFSSPANWPTQSFERKIRLR